MSQAKPYSISHPDCSGCQACIEMCPELFAWDDVNEQVRPLHDCADPETIQKAMAYCPNDCLDYEDD